MLCNWRCFKQLLWLLLLSQLMIGQLQAQDDCSIFPDLDTIYLQTTCDGEASLCTDVSVNDNFLYRFINNGEVLESVIDCNFDTIGFYSAISSTFLSPNLAPFFVNNWVVNGVNYSGEFVSIEGLMDSLNTWDPGGSWRYNSSRNLIVGGLSHNMYGELVIEILLASTSIVSAYQVELIPRNVGIPLTVGTHELTGINLSSQCRDNIVAEVVCTTKDTIALTINVGETRNFCLDDTELIGQRKRIRNRRFSSFIYDLEVVRENCLALRGTGVGMDTSLIVLCDELGVCDSTTLIVSVRRKPPQLRQTAVTKGDYGIFCINADDLSFPSDIVRFENVCDQAEHQFAAFEINESSLCIEYQGLEVGKDSLCLLACDVFNNCDTLNFRLTVVEPFYVYDTLLANHNTVQYCLSQNAFTSESIFVQEKCATPIDLQHINFDVDEKELCVRYRGLNIGTDSTCIVLIDEFGNATVTIFKITVTAPQPTAFSDSLFINETKTFCLERGELPGNLTDIFNICPRRSGEKVDFFILDSTCVEITGLRVGIEEACLVICDDLGYCDTTFTTVKVLPYPFNPIAVDDFDSTVQGQNITIPVLDNDEIIGGVNVINVVKSPQYGKAIINSNQTISYFPFEQTCLGRDEFTYIICNSNGCDNAVVTIDIQCEDVQVFNAMSPNGDGFNDTFFVGNIEAHPDNHLQIYNRWGNLVYEAFNYQNDWKGTWNGKLLPDGTYFYILSITDNGVTSTQRGQIELHR